MGSRGQGNLPKAVQLVRESQLDSSSLVLESACLPTHISLHCIMDGVVSTSQPCTEYSRHNSSFHLLKTLHGQKSIQPHNIQPQFKKQKTKKEQKESFLAQLKEREKKEREKETSFYRNTVISKAEAFLAHISLPSPLYP